MVQSRFTNIRSIPTKVATGKSAPSTTNFADGIATYQPNDTMKNSQLRLAENARFDRIGEYKTRKGYTALMEPIGASNMSTNLSSADTDTTIDKVEAYTFTPNANGVIYEVQIKIKSDGDTYAVPKVGIYSGDELIAESCIDPATITDTYQTLKARFMNTPNVYTTETISIVVGTQNNNKSDFIVNTVDGTLACTVRTCTEGAVGNVFEANINGTKTVLFTQGNKLYRMAADGTTTLIRTLPTGVEHVRFNQTQNKIRYADGKEGPRLLDPSNSWADSAITTTDLDTGTDLNYKVRNIMSANNMSLMYFDADDNTSVLWTWNYNYAFAQPVIYSTTVSLPTTYGQTTTVAISTLTALTSKAPSNIEVGDQMYNGSTVGQVTVKSGTNLTVKTVENAATPINSYDKFNTDFKDYIPQVQTGDPLTAMFDLGGVYYFQTRRDKYQMYAQTIDQWSQSRSVAQNGTFSQESVVCDLNYAYFANDTGIYRFNGIDEESITQNTIQNVYDAIPNKENIVLDLYQNRLYVYYTSTSTGVNDHCLVYNINLEKWESFDSNVYVSATSARQNSSGRFLCGHSRIGLIMLAEDDANNYDDLGQAISFNLETAYEHFGTTSQLKRIPKWRPEFATTTNPYSVACGYALDYTDDVQYAFSVNLLNNTTVSENYIWDNPSDYGVPTTPTVLSTIPQVNGEFYRVQLRYQHIAAFEPVTFRSHTVTVQTQRIR